MSDNLFPREPASPRPRIGITMGDPAGIGPEVVLKAVAEEEIHDVCSPVIIGISTDGAAPILGQTIRQRIETLLPPWLAQWGALARELRATVMELS